MSARPETPAALVDRLLRATRPAEIEEVIRAAELDVGAEWSALGGREDNIGTVEQSSDPTLALVERVTNAIDGMLELQAGLSAGRQPKSPRQAARDWYHIPESGLGAMKDALRRSLAEQSIRVNLSESGKDRLPTISIRDYGCGRHPSEFGETLLSIHGGNKRDKFYLMGQYGQGGATTYRFADYSVIISRRDPRLLTSEQDDAVGWSIVRYNELDPDVYKAGRYEYLVLSDGLVPQFMADTADFPAGTGIVHIAYDLHGYADAYTQPRNSVWALFHSALFDPLLPFQIGGDRDADLRVDPNASSVGRIVIGNFARLESSERARGDAEIIPGTPFDIDLGDSMGSATCRYWVLRRPEASESRTPPADAYVRADAAVTTTLFGQRQDTQSRTWLKENTRLPYLSRNLIVQVDADGLSSKAKRLLFASTRETAIRSELRETIYDSVAAELARNELLRSLEEDEKERALSRGTRKVSDRVRKKLAGLIKKRIPGAFRSVPDSEGNGSSTKPRRKKPRRKQVSPVLPDDSDLPASPTRLEIRTKPVRIQRGRTAVVRIGINAKNGYLPDHDSDLKVSVDAAGVHIQRRSHLRGGECSWTLRAEPDASLEGGSLSIRLAVPGGKVLKDTATIEVREQRRRGGIKREPETGPEVVWIDEDGWPDDWDVRTVGDVNEGATVQIRLNKAFDSLAKELRKPGLTEAQVEIRQERYLYPVACSLYFQEHAARQLPEAERPLDTYRKAEACRIAEAVLMAISPDVEDAGVSGA